MASLCNPWFTTTNLSYRFPIFETSATALCGTTGIEGSLEVKLPTIWRDEKAVSREKSQKKEDAGARKGRKVAKHCVFPMICGSGGSKSRLAKAAGAEKSGEMRDEKLHAVVARSRFRSEKVQNTSAPDHFWKLRCWKSARRCGAKHISKSKCTKHIKTPQCRTTFGSCDVGKVHAVVARSTFPSQNVQNTTCSRHFGRFRCGFASLHYTTLHYTTLHYTTLHYITLHYTPQHYNYNYTTTLHYTPLHSTTLNYTTLHSTTLHYTTLPSTTLHYITLHYTTLHYTTTTTTQLHSTTLHYTKLHYTTWHYTTLHYTTLHYTTLPSTTPHYITLHYTPLHYNYNYNCNYTTTLHYTTLHYTTLHSTTLHSTTLHYTTLHYTTLH